jgi:hypothetical protein
MTHKLFFKCETPDGSVTEAARSGIFCSFFDDEIRSMLCVVAWEEIGRVGVESGGTAGMLGRALRIRPGDGAVSLESC